MVFKEVDHGRLAPAQEVERASAALITDADAYSRQTLMGMQKRSEGKALGTELVMSSIFENLGNFPKGGDQNSGDNQLTAAKSQRAARSLAGDIADAAESLSGKPLWKRSSLAGLTENGKYGCAVSVCEALQSAGYACKDTATVGGLDEQLRRKGWKRHPIDEAKPGDVVIAYRGNDWREGGGKAHTGIVGNDGLIYNNSKREGAKWTGETLSVGFGHYPNRYVLRPPS